jgi:flagellar biosynthesis protein FlhG
MPADDSRIKMHQTPSNDKSVPLLVTILSGKGGTGKSVLAYNLSDVLSREGHRVLLIDANWQSGCLHIMANAEPTRALNDVVMKEANIEDTIVRLRPNFDLIASPSYTGQADQFNSESWARFLGFARDRFAGYDMLILDTPSCDLELIALTAAASDINLMVLTPELTSIAGNFGLYKFLIKEFKNADINIFVNRVKNGKESEYIYQKFSVLSKRFLGKVPFNAGYLPEDKTVPEALGRQKPLVAISSESAAAVQILNLCKFLTNQRGGGTGLQQARTKTSINYQTALADIKDDI